MNGTTRGSGQAIDAGGPPGADQPAGEQDATTVASARPAATLGRLELALAASGRPGPAPVERWNPPYCGDVGLAIAGDGTWSYRGSPIARPELVRLFAGVLRRDADGRHYLVTPVEKVDVAVADAPFLAVELEAIGDGAERTLVVRTNVGDVVRIGPANPLRFALEANTGGVKPYVLVRGRLEALASRAVAHELLDLVEPVAPVAPDQGCEPARYAVRSGGALFFLPSQGDGADVGAPPGGRDGRKTV